MKHQDLMRMQSSMCLDEMVPPEDHMEFVCVEINMKRETVLLRMLENVQTMLVRKSRFF